MSVRRHACAHTGDAAWWTHKAGRGGVGKRLVSANGTAYGSFFFVFDPAKYPDVKYDAPGHTYWT